MLLNRHLFVYGTLLYESVWQEIVGHHSPKHEAKILDWERFYVKEKCYPGIKYLPSAEVDGALVTNLTADDWRKLDDFEDDIYSKKLLDVHVSDGSVVHAYVYAVEDGNDSFLSDKIWDAAEFERNKLEEFMRILKFRH